MSVGPLADLSGGLIVGPMCVTGGSCEGDEPEQIINSFNDYGPARTILGDSGSGGDCCKGCFRCESSSSSSSSGQPGTGSLDGSGFSHLLSSLSSVIPLCATCCVHLRHQLPSRPPSDLSPVAVPGPGSAFSQAVTVETITVPAVVLSGLWVNCHESGVTLSSGCSAVTFYHIDNATKTYTSQAGTALQCPSGPTSSYGTRTNSGTPPNPVTIRTS